MIAATLASLKYSCTILRLVLLHNSKVEHCSKPNRESKLMLDQVYQLTSNQFIHIDLRKKLLKIMGQFLEYITTVFTGASSAQGAKGKSGGANHVTFAENSFTQAFGRGAQEQAAKLETLRQSNRKTIYTYELVVIIAFLVHFSFVLWPRIQLESFRISEPHGWQFLTLNLIPCAVQFAAIYAMTDLNKPIPDGTKLTSKNSALELNKNEFVQSLKLVVCLVALAQVLSIYSEVLMWAVIALLPLWCCQLTSRLSRSEHNRLAPSPKKSWVKLNAAKSPKATTPSKQQQAQPGSAKKDDPTKATPRTRTRKAVKNLISSATDKYHAFEQSVAQQITSIQNMGSPLRSGKAIAYGK